MLTHGYRIEPESEASRYPSASALPHWPHVSFFSADWVVTTNREISGPYDVILALSVIKWIHLEHLDQGLRTLFAKCSSSLNPGGHLVVEIQPWDSYEKAIRPNTAPHFIHNFKQLQYRPETSFDQLLAEDGLCLCASSTALPREIRIYRKNISHIT